MLFRTLAFLLLLGPVAGPFAGAQTVTVTATDPDYAGARIEVSIPGHPFLDEPRFTETLRCDSGGSFRMEMELEEACMVRFRTGIYDAGLYVEPGNTYWISLPPYRPSPYAERISPFFQPLALSLRVEGRPGDVNNEICRFDSLFHSLNEQVILSRRQGRDPAVDSLRKILDMGFPGSGNPWFEAYRRYKTGVLVLNAGRSPLAALSQAYLGPEVREDHPAYLELFGAMFRDFLIYYGRTKEGKGIRGQINRNHNLDSLRAIVRGHPAVDNDTLADLILLQELPSLFYSGDYHKEAILILLDSLETDPVKAPYGRYTRQLRDKLASLVIGNLPPHFELEDADGRPCTPECFKGKYTYLLFGTLDHYGCLMEYPFLQSYQEKHDAYLNVVTIMVAADREAVDAFMERNHYSWKALFYEGQDRILHDYMVRAFPVAYLLGPDGRLLLSPASLPSDGFEQQLFRIMRSRGEL